jgi:TPR repeat protein
MCVYKIQFALLNVQKALEIYERAARRGSAKGLYTLGQMYSNGYAGLTRDFGKKMECCLKAAAQKPYVSKDGRILPNPGVAEAENSIAISYKDGIGVDQVVVAL